MATKKKAKRTKKGKTKEVDDTALIQIDPPTTKIITIPIRGIAPYVQNKMSEEAFNRMREDMEDPDGKKQRARDRRQIPRNFEEESTSASHISSDGWYGIPAHGMMQALVRAIDAVPDFPMTKGKAALAVEPDGFSSDTGSASLGSRRASPT